MNCHVCQTSLPDDAICCYRCGTFIDGAIRQVEPLSVFEDEQTTEVKPRKPDPPPNNPVPKNKKSAGRFFKIALPVVLLAAGATGLLAFLAFRSHNSPPPVNSGNSIPVMTATPTPAPKKTASPSPTPAPNVNTANNNTANQSNSGGSNSNHTVNSPPTNTQTLPAEQLQRGFEVSGGFLKNDMLNAAIEKAKSKHPLSKLEDCSQNVERTSQSSSREEYTGTYECRLRGYVFGRSVFETVIIVRGKIESRSGSFTRSISGTEVVSDQKLSN